MTYACRLIVGRILMKSDRIIIALSRKWLVQVTCHIWQTITLRTNLTNNCTYGIFHSDLIDLNNVKPPAITHGRYEWQTQSLHDCQHNNFLCHHKFPVLFKWHLYFRQTNQIQNHSYPRRVFTRLNYISKIILVTLVTGWCERELTHIQRHTSQLLLLSV